MAAGDATPARDTPVESASGTGASGLLPNGGGLARARRGASPSANAPTFLPFGSRATACAALLLLGGLGALLGTPVLRLAAACLVVYLGGHVVGSLLLARTERRGEPSRAILRTVAGLLLTTLAYLLSLVLSLPWFTGPCMLVAMAALVGRRSAFTWGPGALAFRRDSVLAGIVALVILSPSWVSYVYMAPGSFPPVFYNVDTAYGLEKVHAIVAADSYPPPSLGNVGVSRTYHYGSYAMAALVSRGSGLPPHQALFVFVLPLLVAGVLASAFAIARFVGPAVPRSVAVPLLLLSVPSLYVPFWERLGPRLGAVMADAAFWGVLSNEGANVGGDFVVLGSIAAIAATPAWGWMLPAFLIGSAVMVKSTTGMGLVAGFGLAEGWRMFTARRPWPSPLAVGAAAVFIATCAAFLLVSFEGTFRLEATAFYHLLHTWPAGLAMDLGWLLLPAAIVLASGVADSERRSLPFLLMGLGPLLVVNVSHLNHVLPGGVGTGNDWLQTLRATPLLLHAFVLSVASRRWSRIGRPRRVAFITAAALAIVPVVIAAGGYTYTLITRPSDGYEFVDNRSMAAALATIPTRGSVIVTNDLRYPAGRFARDERQMQIPALFGHQAFAVNYIYEAVEERRDLQQLLKQLEWGPAIPEAARRHGWTHYLVRKDYPHPSQVPLERLFENEEYVVYAFP